MDGAQRPTQVRLVRNPHEDHGRDIFTPVAPGWLVVIGQEDASCAPTPWREDTYNLVGWLECYCTESLRYWTEPAVWMHGHLTSAHELIDSKQAHYQIFVGRADDPPVTAPTW
jgi:hypothetical protein